MIRKVPIGWVASLIPLIFLGAASWATLGSSSGGGNAASCTAKNLNQGHPILLDFAQNEPDYSDVGSDQNPLKPTDVSHRLGLDYLDISKTSAYKLSLSKLMGWAHACEKPTTRQPDFAHGAARQIKDILDQIAFTTTPYRLNLHSRDAIGSDSPCDKANVQVVNYYIDQMSVISIPAWNELGPMSQAGVLIHDVLRQIQLFNGKNASDDELQRLTTHILIDPPTCSKGLALDDDRFFQLHIDPEKFEKDRAEICGLAKSKGKQLWSSLTSKLPALAQLCNSDQQFFSESAANLSNTISAISNTFFALSNETMGHDPCNEKFTDAVLFSKIGNLSSEMGRILTQDVITADDKLLSGATLNLATLSTAKSRAETNLSLYARYMQNPMSVNPEQRDQLAAFEQTITKAIRAAAIPDNPTAMQR